MSSRTTGGRVRIGDAERDAAAATLGEHFASGRLTRDEFDERLERAWAAKTAEDIDPLFVDLPRTASLGAPVGVAAGEPVGFGPRRGSTLEKRRRTPFGLPPPLAIVLMVLLVVTVLTHLPIVLLALGAMWFTGMIGHRGAGRGPCGAGMRMR